MVYDIAIPTLEDFPNFKVEHMSFCWSAISRSGSHTMDAWGWKSSVHGLTGPCWKIQCVLRCCSKKYGGNLMVRGWKLGYHEIIHLIRDHSKSELDNMFLGTASCSVHSETCPFSWQFLGPITKHTLEELSIANHLSWSDAFPIKQLLQVIEGVPLRS